MIITTHFETSTLEILAHVFDSVKPPRPLRPSPSVQSQFNGSRGEQGNVPTSFFISSLLSPSGVSASSPSIQEAYQ